MNCERVSCKRASFIFATNQILERVITTFDISVVRSTAVHVFESQCRIVCNIECDIVLTCHFDLTFRRFAIMIIPREDCINYISLR